jgi:hypothetical protein
VRFAILPQGLGFRSNRHLGVLFAPSTVLDAWLKAMVEKRGSNNELKPANLYQGSIFAWNAHREGKTIQTIRFDAKKGLYDVHE